MQEEFVRKVLFTCSLLTEAFILGHIIGDILAIGAQLWHSYLQVHSSQLGTQGTFITIKRVARGGNIVQVPFYGISS